MPLSTNDIYVLRSIRDATTYSYLKGWTDLTEIQVDAALRRLNSAGLVSLTTGTVIITDAGKHARETFFSSSLTSEDHAVIDAVNAIKAHNQSQKHYGFATLDGIVKHIGDLPYAKVKSTLTRLKRIGIVSINGGSSYSWRSGWHKRYTFTTFGEQFFVQ